MKKLRASLFVIGLLMVILPIMPSLANIELFPGTAMVVNNCDTVTGWSCTQLNDVITVDSVDKVEGAGSVSIYAPESSWAINYMLLLDYIDLTDHSILSFSIKLDTLSSGSPILTMRTGGGSLFSHYALNLQSTEWQTFEVDLTQGYTGDTPDLSSVRIFQIDLGTGLSYPTGPCTLKIDNIQAGLLVASSSPEPTVTPVPTTTPAPTPSPTPTPTTGTFPTPTPMPTSSALPSSPPTNPNITKVTLEITQSIGGNITPEAGSYEYDKGVNIVLTATPQADYQFSKWVTSNGEIYRDRQFTLTLQESMGIRAEFELITLDKTIERVFMGSQLVGAVILLIGALGPKISKKLR